MSIEKKAFEAYEKNRNLAPKYQVGDSMWMDWYSQGYRQAKQDLEITAKVKKKIRVHLGEYIGKPAYVFTKDKNHCLLIEYDKDWDFGEGSPSGTNFNHIEIHTKNGFRLELFKEISIEEVPKCIIDLLRFLN